MVRKTETLTVDQQISNEVERQVSEQLNPPAMPGMRIGAQYDETDDDFSLTNVLAELGSSVDDAKVNVYQMEAGKPMAFVDSFAPNDFSLETLKQIYGAGTYKIQIRANGRIIPGGKTVRIAKAVNPSGIPVPQFAPDKLIDTMNIGFERLGSMFAQAIQSLSANQPKPKTTMETLEELRLMREIMGGNAAPAPPQDPYAILSLASELAGKMNPGPQDENTVLLEGIKQFGPLLQTIMSGQQGQPASAGHNGTVRALPQSQARPGPVPSPQGSTESDRRAVAQELSAVPLQTSENVDVSLMINMYLKTLVANAQADNDPMTYAQAIMDFMGDDEAVKLANNPEWFKLLCERVPEAAPYQIWFDELRQGILYLTKPDELDTHGDIQNPDNPENAPESLPAAAGATPTA
jgi:hypothetical protein